MSELKLLFSSSQKDIYIVQCVKNATWPLMICYMDQFVALQDKRKSECFG